MVEKLVLFAFAMFLTVLYVWALGIVLGVVWQWIRRGPRPPIGRGRRFVRRVVLSGAAVGVACIAYAHWIEPYWLEQTHVVVATAKLPHGAQPIRIVHITDTHCDTVARLESRLADDIAALKPDLIVFTGDAVNREGDVEIFRRLAGRLVAVAPTFAVRGNWDWRRGDRPDIFDGTGMRELCGEAVEFTVRGQSIWLIGGYVGYHYAPDRYWPAIEQAIDSVPDGAFRLLLYHYPWRVLEAAGKVDLMLSGHTHGGQVALPFYGALTTLSLTGKRFEKGLYAVDGTEMYVSRGVGTEGDPVPRVRFLARPELTLVEIVPK